MYKLIYAFIMLMISNCLLADVYNRLPKELGELVKTSDLILIGTIGEIIDERLFYGYQDKDNADRLAQKEQETPFTLGLPLVDYTVHVQEIIMDDKRFPLTETNTHTIIYRTFEDHDEVSSASAVNDRRGKMVFFLSRNPVNETYGITSFLHKIKLGNGKDEITYSFNKKNLKVPFAIGAKRKDFIEEVKKHASF